MQRASLWSIALIAGLAASGAQAAPVEFTLASAPGVNPLLMEVAARMGVSPEPFAPGGLLTMQNNSPGPFTMGAERMGVGPTPFAPVDFKLGTPPDDGLPASSFFDVFFDIAPLRGSSPSLADPVLGAPPDDTVPGVSFFDVFFDVFVDGGTAHFQVHFAIDPVLGNPPDDQVPGVSFFDVFVEVGNSFDVMFDLLYDGEGSIAPGTTLFTATITGNFVAPEPGALAIFAAGLLVLARFAGRPGAARSARAKASSR